MGLKRKKGELASADTDMTPMIDMTFQLIAFFMVLINFNEVDTHQKVQLPSSELAKPPKTTPPEFFTIQVLVNKNVVIAGNEVPVDKLGSLLTTEVSILRNKRSTEFPNGKGPDLCTVFIRAHKDAQTGVVQSVIKTCQEMKFDKFSLRAEEYVGH